MQISPTLGLRSSTPPISLCSGIYSLSFSQSGAVRARWLIVPQLRSDRHGSNTQQRSKDASDWPGNVDGKAKCFRFKFISRTWFIINYELVWCSFTDNKRLKYRAGISKVKLYNKVGLIWSNMVVMVICLQVWVALTDDNCYKCGVLARIRFFMQKRFNFWDSFLDI